MTQTDQTQKKHSVKTGQSTHIVKYHIGKGEIDGRTGKRKMTETH